MKLKPGMSSALFDGDGSLGEVYTAMYEALQGVKGQIGDDDWYVLESTLSGLILQAAEVGAVVGIQAVTNPVGLLVADEGGN